MTAAVAMCLDFHVVFEPSKRVSLFNKVWAVKCAGGDDPLAEHLTREHAQLAAISYAKTAEAAGGKARVLVHTAQGPVASELHFPVTT
jgi:hypothetical protein